MLPVSGALGESAPALAKGADDIYWVHQVHEALTAHGYYPDDDEAADWFYGDHTASAVTSFQACTLQFNDAICGCCLQVHCLSCVPPYMLPRYSSQQRLPAPGRQGLARDRRMRHADLGGTAGRQVGARAPAGAQTGVQCWASLAESAWARQVFLATSPCDTVLVTGR